MIKDNQITRVTCRVSKCRFNSESKYCLKEYITISNSNKNCIDFLAIPIQKLHTLKPKAQRGEKWENQKGNYIGM